MRKKRLSDFFSREYGRLLGFVRRWIDDAADRDAEDIVQDVMLNIFDRADPFIPIENLTAYVYRALKNRIVDLFRKGKAHAPVENGSLESLSLAEVMAAARCDAAAELEREELRLLLYGALESLDEKDRAIIIATEFEGRSFRNLSEEWAVPMGTLLTRKSRALQKIKKRLNDWIRQ